MRERNYNFLHKISKRELEVLQGLIDCGGEYKAIADKMIIAETTVKTHVNRIFEKLGVTNRTAAVIEGLRRNLIRLHPSETISDPPLEADSMERFGVPETFLLI
jgi:two-component system, NarL family, nitrate/nitrite response regulator NarL